MEDYKFDLPKNKSNVIKVIGVGGGGSNAVNHMFRQGIKGVDYVICNTDSQALANSEVTNKIQLGVSLTEGLGAGADPDVGKRAAEESKEELEAMLETNTKMVFITAGMGGGTGTGAAPIIAKLAKDKEILTVGIVTIPFTYEGKKRSEQAQKGVERLRENVDSLIVINNNKLSEIYGDLGFKAGYAKADEVLATAAKGIAEVISKHYIQNIDLRDAKTVLAKGGTAIMGSAIASGAERAKEAVIGALSSPLLNDNKIIGAQKVLLLIVFGTEEITHSEVEEINMYIQDEAGNDAEIIMGVGEDLELGESISVTVVATGFDPDQEHKIVNTDPKKIIYTLGDEQEATRNLTPEKEITHYRMNEEEITFTEEDNFISVKEENPIFSIEVDYEEVSPDNFFLMNKDKEERKKKTTKYISEEPNVYHFETTENDFKLQSSTFNSDKKKPGQTIDPLTTPLPLSYTEEGITEKNEKKVYSLEDFEEVEKKLSQAQPDSGFELRKELEEEATDVQFKLKKLPEEKVKEEEPKDAPDPVNSSILEAMKKTTERRKQIIKKYNHQFGEDKNTPAYLRQGVVLKDIPSDSKVSKSIIAEDSNGNLQIRKGNSFLHDNAD